MRVLVVEDSDVLRHLLARVLKNVGCEVVEAADAYDALGTAGVSPPDLVVTDLMMPGLDGVGLIPRLRAMPGPATVPVVVVTAAATAEAERAARAAGATAFLAKPVDTPELLGCIGGCL